MLLDVLKGTGPFILTKHYRLWVMALMDSLMRARSLWDACQPKGGPASETESMY